MDATLQTTTATSTTSETDVQGFLDAYQRSIQHALGKQDIDELDGATWRSIKAAARAQAMVEYPSMNDVPMTQIRGMMGGTIRRIARERHTTAIPDSGQRILALYREAADRFNWLPSDDILAHFLEIEKLDFTLLRQQLIQEGYQFQTDAHDNQCVVSTPQQEQVQQLRQREQDLQRQLEEVQGQLVKLVT
jgi:hypothetical protein